MNFTIKLSVSKACLLMGAFATKRLRSDYFSVVGFKQEHVKTVHVDIDHDVNPEEQFMVVVGHMHNPNTLEDKGYMYLQYSPNGWMMSHTTVPNLPFGFTAVTMRGY